MALVLSNLAIIVAFCLFVIFGLRRAIKQVKAELQAEIEQAKNDKKKESDL